MRRVFRWSTGAAALVLIAIQVVRPARTNPAVDAAHTLAASERVPDAFLRTLDRACRDCHSNGTRWPWYSQVAPVSWFVIDHVNHGRSHFNYSEWSRYDADEATRLLKKSCELAREGAMPLASYTWIHRDARLTRADMAALCAWDDAPPTAPAH
jgi:hypothetical protein